MFRMNHKNRTPKRTTIHSIQYSLTGDADHYLNTK